MSMIFSDIIYECRIRGARAVEWMESLIFKEVFNQPLRIVYNIIQGQEMTLNMNTGLYNTLSPYLFDASYHLTPTREERLTSGKFTNVDDRQVQEDHVENMVITKSEKRGDINPEVVADVPEKNVLEKIESENKVIDDQTSERQEQKMDSEDKKAQKKGKKGKKQKKKSYTVKGLSVFTLWLLDQKPLDDKTANWQKKSGKKNKRDESAQKSITPSDEIISESLALILTRQGHYLEAKKMFKKLIVKFPDKAAYYQSEIDKLNMSM